MREVKKKIIEYSLENKSIKIDFENPFTWASGYKMPIYNDNRKLLSSYEIRSLITDEFKNIINEEIDIIAGTATSGIPFATSLADALEKPMIYVRSRNKDHGTESSVEGFVPWQVGQKAILIEDVISTGKSAFKASERIQEVGIQVVNIFSIFDYQFTNVLIHKSIYNLDDLIEYGFDELEEWKRSPFTWGRNK